MNSHKKKLFTLPEMWHSCKGIKLREANQQQQFNRNVEDIELWLYEVEGHLASDDYGKDLTSVQNLQKKHALLEADVAAHQVTTQCTHTHRQEPRSVTTDWKHKLALFQMNPVSQNPMIPPLVWVVLQCWHQRLQTHLKAAYRPLEGWGGTVKRQTVAFCLAETLWPAGHKTCRQGLQRAQRLQLASEALGLVFKFFVHTWTSDVFYIKRS